MDSRIAAVCCVEVDMERLDDTDERILAELTENARATFAEIGQRVNLSARRSSAGSIAWWRAG